VSVSEQVPSNEWTALWQVGAEIAEAQFQLQGDRFTLVVRIPRDRLQLADPSGQLTIENLLDAASVSKDQVESWDLGDVSKSGSDAPDSEWKHPLPPPSADATHLTVYVHLKPPTQADASTESVERDVPVEKWQSLDALWKAILGLEAAIDSLRLSMDGVRAEMEAGFRKTLSVEEKVHALQADVLQWNKAKNRIHYALPKVREFIHRATWATGVPERKRLGELVRTHIEPRIPLPQMDEVREAMEHLQKDRQVLFAQGNSVHQECRVIVAEIQRALSTLQRNAVDRARQKRSAGRDKGKHL
jgi:hypothetical protein